MSKAINTAMLIGILASVGCARSNAPAQNNISGSAHSALQRPTISEDRFSKLSTVDDIALLKMALEGDLGNCRLIKISDTGCGGSDSPIPLYSIELKNENIALPNSGNGTPSRYCKDRAVWDLRAAVLEGYCFSKQVPLEQFSDYALTRKAFLGELGNCKLEKFSDSGCGGPDSGLPLYRIAFTDKSVFLRTVFSDKDNRYCFDRAGGDLRKVLNEGMCFRDR